MTKLAKYIRDNNLTNTSFAKRAKVSRVTINAVADKGLKLKLYRIAKRIADATDGAITLEELCE